MTKDIIVGGIAMVAIVLAASAYFSTPELTLGNRTQSFSDAAQGFYVSGARVLTRDCLSIRDSSTPSNTVYITATGATITASTTAPAGCQ